jgi:hypothetical protein
MAIRPLLPATNSNAAATPAEGWGGYSGDRGAFSPVPGVKAAPTPFPRRDSRERGRPAIFPPRHGRLAILTPQHDPLCQGAPLAHTPPRDPRSCVLHWSWFCVSRVELVRPRRGAKRSLHAVPRLAHSRSGDREPQPLTAAPRIHSPSPQHPDPQSLGPSTPNPQHLREDDEGHRRKGVLG